MERSKFIRNDERHCAGTAWMMSDGYSNVRRDVFMGVCGKQEVTFHTRSPATGSTGVAVAVEISSEWFWSAKVREHLRSRKSCARISRLSVEPYAIRG